MLFQLDFGCMVHSFKRSSGKTTVCLVLVSAVAFFTRGLMHFLSMGLAMQVSGNTTGTGNTHKMHAEAL